MKYKGGYLWPPRPTTAVPVAILHTYEGYTAQVKKNGQCEIIIISPDRKVTTFNRHQEAHKNWRPVPNEFGSLRRLPGDNWIVFVAELMHGKTTHIKNTHYIHDILVYDTFLYGMTFVERQKLLHGLFDYLYDTHTHHVVDKHIWVAKNHEKNFDALFESLDSIEDEGLVLKKNDSTLDFCIRPTSNEQWQFKCRKPHKNYSF